MANWYDSLDLGRDICANCGHNAGLHSGDPTMACPDKNGSLLGPTGSKPYGSWTPMTNTTYINPFSNPNDWYHHIPFSDLCDNCGEDCGGHHGVSACCQHGAHPPGSKWKAKSSAAKRPDPFIGTPKPSAKKPLSPECPCGINRASCTYHCS